MSKEQSNTAKLLYIDGLKAVAAIYVLFHHAALQYFEAGPDGLYGIQKAIIYALHQGQLFVDLFIVLSGYCLMLPIIKAGYELRGGSAAFFKKRIIRILPPYYLAMLVSLILIWLFVGQKTGTHWDISIPVNFKSVVLHTFLIHDIFSADAFTINHSFWSISVESRIYVLFPFMIYLWRRKGPWYTLSVFTIVSILIYQVLYIIQHKTNAINLYTPGFSPYVILFILGMLAADFSVPGSKLAVISSKVNWSFAFVLAVAIFVVTRIVINQRNIDAQTFTYQLINIAFGLICFVLLIICAKPETNKIFLSLRNILSWQPLVFIGTFAYSIYLIHAPLIQLLTQYMVVPLRLSPFNSCMVLLALCMVFIIPIAYLFFVLCERPFIKLGRKHQTTSEAVILSAAP